MNEWTSTTTNFCCFSFLFKTKKNKKIERKKTKTDLLKTQVDSGGEEAVRSTVAVVIGNDAVHPRLVHRRQVQFGCHRTIGNDLIFLFVGEHVVHAVDGVVVAAAKTGRADHHIVAVVETDSADGTVQHAVHVVGVHVVVMMELVARREEQRRRTLEHVVVSRHSCANDSMMNNQNCLIIFLIKLQLIRWNKKNEFTF